MTKNKTGLASYTIDLINPFVKVEEVYGALPDEPSKSWDDAATGKKDYAYTVKTYTKSGKARTVAVNAFGGKFDKNTKLLKIMTKGQSVRSYTSISETDVPAAALKEIKSK
ncbi:YxeA family protein [Lactovum odontotermitis]